MHLTALLVGVLIWISNIATLVGNAIAGTALFRSRLAAAIFHVGMCLVDYGRTTGRF